MEISQTPLSCGSLAATGNPSLPEKAGLIYWKKGKERREIVGKAASALGNGLKAVVPKEIERYRSHNGKIR
ncbi:MAG: hypothetical protein ACAF41_32940 [Leptolyngbya sp. BL-A-14]